MVVRYDHNCRNWIEDAEINQLFIDTVMRFMHDRLVFRGHVFLNEVLDQLGLPRQRNGQLFGWVFTYPTVPELYRAESKEDGAIDIMFQTEGNILDRIKEWK